MEWRMTHIKDWGGKTVKQHERKQQQHLMKADEKDPFAYIDHQERVYLADADVHAYPKFLMIRGSFE